jgi:hypothetical protein
MRAEIDQEWQGNDYIELLKASNQQNELRLWRD